MVLDDLHWSDEATLELLSALAEPLARAPAAGASPPTAPTACRATTACGGCATTCAAPAGSTSSRSRRWTSTRPPQLLAHAARRRARRRALARAIHDRTQGIPFFVEELAGALRVSGALQPGRRGLELAGDGDVPLPDTVRDAVLISASELSDDGRAAAEVAAVAGESFDLELVAGARRATTGLPSCSSAGSCARSRGRAARSGTRSTREALYADVPWMRRRTLHRALAEALEAAGAPSREVAPHWLGARDGARAREALLRAAAESEAVHAYRDAAEARPPGARAVARRATTRTAGARGARALRALLPARRRAGRGRARAGASSSPSGAADAPSSPTRQRALAAVHELRGDREAAFAARRLAAEAFAATAAPAEAAVERLAMANQRRPRRAPRRGHRARAGPRAAEADRAGRLDLRIRALGLEGMARAKHGDYEAGLEIVRGGLALALEHDLTVVAAELYQRLSVTLYESADYRRAEEALDTALELCRASPDAGAEGACVTCMAYVLRERGEWSRAAEICRDLIAERHGRVRRRGPARRDPRVRGQARAPRGGCSPPRWPSPRGSATTT